MNDTVKRLVKVNSLGMYEVYVRYPEARKIIAKGVGLSLPEATTKALIRLNKKIENITKKLGG